MRISGFIIPFADALCIWIALGLAVAVVLLYDKELTESEAVRTVEIHLSIASCEVESMLQVLLESTVALGTMIVSENISAAANSYATDVERYCRPQLPLLLESVATNVLSVFDFTRGNTSDRNSFIACGCSRRYCEAHNASVAYAAQVLLTQNVLQSDNASNLVGVFQRVAETPGLALKLAPPPPATGFPLRSQIALGALLASTFPNAPSTLNASLIAVPSLNVSYCVGFDDGGLCAHAMTVVADITQMLKSVLESLPLLDNTIAVLMDPTDESVIGSSRPLLDYVTVARLASAGSKIFATNEVLPSVSAAFKSLREKCAYSVGSGTRDVIQHPVGCTFVSIEESTSATHDIVSAVFISMKHTSAKPMALLLLGSRVSYLNEAAYNHELLAAVVVPIGVIIAVFSVLFFVRGRLFIMRLREKTEGVANMRAHSEITRDWTFLSEFWDIQDAVCELNERFKELLPFLPQSFLRNHDAHVTCSVSPPVTTLSDEKSSKARRLGEDIDVGDLVELTPVLLGDATLNRDLLLDRNSNLPDPSDVLGVLMVRKVTVLYANMCGFMSALDRMSTSRDLRETHGIVLERIVGIAHEFVGVVEWFHGDHFLISFNASTPCSAPAAVAVAQTLLAVDEELKAMTITPAGSSNLDILAPASVAGSKSLLTWYRGMRWGVATGDALCGKFGSASTIVSNGIVGPCVNQSFALMQQCKAEGVNNMCCGSTSEILMKHFAPATRLGSTSHNRRDVPYHVLHTALLSLPFTKNTVFLISSLFPKGTLSDDVVERTNRAFVFLQEGLPAKARACMVSLPLDISKRLLKCFRLVGGAPIPKPSPRGGSRVEFSQ